MNYFFTLFIPLTLIATTPNASSAASGSGAGNCTQLTPVASGPNSAISPRSKVRGRPFVKRPIPALNPAPSSTIGPKEPTTFPAPLTNAEMDAAEVRGKAMQKQMMDRKEAEDAKNTGPPISAKATQVLTKQGCIPVPMPSFGPEPTTTLPPPSTK